MIAIEREPSWLDRLVMEFVRCLGFNYVIVAGYVAILLGRTRTTDDVDVVVDAASGAEVAARVARCGFKPLTLGSNLDYEFRHLSVRFYKPPAVLPNFEVKPPRSFYQRYALARRVAVSIAGRFCTCRRWSSRSPTSCGSAPTKTLKTRYSSTPSPS